MGMSVRDRKLLWANAGGACAICKKHLTETATNADPDAVVGIEAHIVSPKERATISPDA
jgi:hypothetical protein